MSNDQNQNKQSGASYQMIEFDKCKLDFSADYIQKNTPNYFSTGFKGLDDLLGGGISPGLTVLGAISSLGKSTFYLQLAQNIANDDNPVLYFSLEMPRYAISLKSLDRYAFKERKTEEFSNKRLSDEEYVALRNEMRGVIKSKYADLSEEQKKQRDEFSEKCVKECENLFVIERNDVNVFGEFSAEAIRKNVENYIENEKKKARESGEDEDSIKKPIVFVDYLQILISQTDKTHKTDKQIVDENIKALWNIANTYQIPVMVISSVNRDSYSKSISFSSFKESGGIEYTSDIVLGMQFSAVRTAMRNNVAFDPDSEKGKEQREVELIVLKQRYGRCGSDAYVNLVYYPEFSYFEEVKRVKKSAEDNADETNAETAQKPKARKG